MTHLTYTKNPYVTVRCGVHQQHTLLMTPTDLSTPVGRAMCLQALGCPGVFGVKRSQWDIGCLIRGSYRVFVYGGFILGFLMGSLRVVLVGFLSGFLSGFLLGIQLAF